MAQYVLDMNGPADVQQLEKTVKNVTRGICGAMKEMNLDSRQALDPTAMQAYIRSAAFFEEKLSDSLLCLRLNLGKLKAAFSQAVAPIASVFVPFLNQAVMALTGMVRSIAQVIRALIGGVFQIDALAGSSDKATDAQDKLGKALRNTTKAIRRSLAGFDELERLNELGKGSSLGGLPEKLPEETQKLGIGLQFVVEKIQQLLGYLQRIDTSAAVQALRELWAAVEPLTASLFQGLEWAYIHIFVPLAQWTIEDFLPAFLRVLAAALRALNEVLEALKPLGDWLWQNFLQPLAQWTGGAILDVLTWLKDKLDAISTWIRENQELVQKIGAAVLAVVTVLTLLNAAMGVFGGLGNSGAASMGLFANGLNALGNPMTVVTLAVAALSAALVLLILNWDNVKEKAAQVWENIKTTWGNAVQWFKTTVLDPLKNGVKSMANGVIGYLNGMISAAVKAVNSLVRAVNTIRFTVPDWIPGYGGKTLGFSLKTVTCPQIPYLAQGAVLPANKPFLAMVGDQRHGTNIEAPLSTIQEAVALVMEDQTAAILAGFEASVGVQKDILEAVLGIRIGDEVIAGAVERYNQRKWVMQGGWV